MATKTATQLLNRRDCAARIGCHPQTVIRLVAARKLRETRIPSARGTRSMPRYKVTDIEAFIASGYTR